MTVLLYLIPILSLLFFGSYLFRGKSQRQVAMERVAAGLPESRPLSVAQEPRHQPRHPRLVNARRQHRVPIGSRSITQETTREVIADEITPLLFHSSPSFPEEHHHRHHHETDCSSHHSSSDDSYSSGGDSYSSDDSGGCGGYD